jgi:uncharacterized protein YacL
MTDEHSIMPLAIHKPLRLHFHVPEIHLSPMALAVIAMGTTGILVHQLARVFPSSPFAMAVHSDLGQLFAIINAAGVLVAGLSLLIQKGNERMKLAARERAEIEESRRNSPRMPDSDEVRQNGMADIDRSKMDRIKRRREESK